MERVGKLVRRVAASLLTLAALVAGSVDPSQARVATLTFVGIGQVSSVGGTFAANGFMNGDVVDMTIEIEETTVGAGGTYNDPASVTTFIRQANPSDTVTFTGFGFEMADATRLDQASAPTAAEGTYWVGGVIQDWDLHNINPPISDITDLFTILRELPDAAIGSVSASFQIDAPAAGGANVTQFIGLKPTVTLTVGCGNGTVDPMETCDDPFCCDATCDNAQPDGTTCRAAAGLCDIAETCSSGACPPDALSPMGTECRASAGACDPAEQCTGSSPDCPPDTLTQFTCGTICRPAQDECDTASICEAGNPICPGTPTLCTPTATTTPTATSTPTATPTATSTPTATATGVPEGGACADISECETGLACVAGICTDVTVPAPATSWKGLLIALAVLMLGAYTVLGRGRKEQ